MYFPSPSQLYLKRIQFLTLQTLNKIKMLHTINEGKENPLA